MKKFIVLFLLASAAVASGTGISEIIRGIQKVNDQLVNLYIEGKTVSQDWDPKTNQWVATPARTHCKLSFDGTFNGKCSVDFTPWFAREGKDNAPYIEQTFSIAFNGKYGSLIEHSAEPLSGKIYKRTPPYLAMPRWWSGEEFCVNLAKFDRGCNDFGKNVLILLQNSKEFLPVVSTERVNGKEMTCITIRFARKNMEEVLWLDPAKSFAMVKRESRTLKWSRGETTNFKQDAFGPIGTPTGTKTEYHVLEMKEILPGCWYPTKAELIKHFHGKPEYKATWEAIKVTVNNKFDDAIFTIQFPADCKIKDERDGGAFLVPALR